MVATFVIGENEVLMPLSGIGVTYSGGRNTKVASIKYKLTFSQLSFDRFNIKDFLVDNPSILLYIDTTNFETSIYNVKKTSTQSSESLVDFTTEVWIQSNVEKSYNVDLGLDKSILGTSPYILDLDIVNTSPEKEAYIVETVTDTFPGLNINLNGNFLSVHGIVELQQDIKVETLIKELRLLGRISEDVNCSLIQTQTQAEQTYTSPLVESQELVDVIVERALNFWKEQKSHDSYSQLR